MTSVAVKTVRLVQHLVMVKAQFNAQTEANSPVEITKSDKQDDYQSKAPCQETSLQRMSRKMFSESAAQTRPCFIPTPPSSFADQKHDNIWKYQVNEIVLTEAKSDQRLFEEGKS